MTSSVWFTRCPVPTAFGIAVADGTLADALRVQGVDLRSLATSTDRAVRDAHFTQGQPRSLRHGGNIPPLVAASRGQALRVIGLSVAPSNAGLLALSESAITGPSDLRGKTIGVPRRTNDTIDFWRASALQAIFRALRAGGLSPADVSLRDIDVDRMYVDGATRKTRADTMLWDASFMIGFQREESMALLNRDVDVIFSEGANHAITTALTGAIQIHTAGAAGPVTPADSTNLRPLTLTASVDLIEDSPDLVDLVLREVQRSARWATTQRVTAARLLASEVGLPEELLGLAFSPDVTESLEVDLSADKVAALNQQSLDLLDHGIIEEPVDVRTLIDYGPLQRAGR